MSLVGTLNDFTRAMQATRRLILAVILIVAAGALAFSAANNAINYTKVEARVERVGILCRAKGTPIAEAVDCADRGATPAPGAKIIRNAAVYVRYTSPADRKDHQGRIVAVGTNQLKQVRTLRPGDSWTIWAHDDQPDAIKIY